MLTLALQLFASFLTIVVVGGALVACHDVLARASTRAAAPRPRARATFPGPQAGVAMRRGPGSPVGSTSWAWRRAQAVASD